MENLKRPYRERRKDTRIRKREFYMLEKTALTENLMQDATAAQVAIAARQGLQTTAEKWSNAEIMRRALLALIEQGKG